MNWTVALFGHYKYEYELREKNLTEVSLPKGLNYENKMMYEQVMINKVVGRYIKKPKKYDKDKYFVYKRSGNEHRAKPGDIIAYKPIEKHNTWTTTERQRFLIVKMYGLTASQMQALVEPLWDTSDIGYGPVESKNVFPVYHVKKRRMCITMHDLEAKGIDLNRMLDRQDLYVPGMDRFTRMDCMDKRRDRHIVLSDGLNVIKPRIMGE